MNWKSASGAAPSDMRSMRTSRNGSPAIGKSAGTSIAAITASASAGSLRGKMPRLSPTSYSRPEAERFVRRYTGADDLLNGLERYCLWVTDDEADDANAIPALAERFQAAEVS